MLHVAIIGAGELGGAVAHALARCGLAASVCLIDDQRQTAAGKALDIMQAGPIEGFSTRVSGSTDMFAAAGASVVVVADRADRLGPDAEWQGEEGLTALRRIRDVARGSLILCAGAAQRDLVERGVRDLEFPYARLFASAPEALAGAIRAFVALEANGSPKDVGLTVLGIPPGQIVVPWDQSTIGGLTLTSVLDEQAIRRLAARIPALWPPGSHALAAAAIKAFEAISGTSRRLVSCFVAPDRALGERTHAVALPVRLGPEGVDGATVPQLSGHDRVALDNAMLL